MNPNTLTGGTPVRRLQEMLRTLTHVHREIPFLIPNGIFGEGTLEGVMVFQRIMGLPVTGTVDQTTWDAISEEYDRVEHQLSAPRAVSLLPHNPAVIRPGQSSPLLYPIQGMLLVLSDVFASVRAVQPSGTLDSGTAGNLRWIQRSGHLEETGALDRETWDLLARVYETFVVRQPQV